MPGKGRRCFLIMDPLLWWGSSIKGSFSCACLAVFPFEETNPGLASPKSAPQWKALGDNPSSLALMETIPPSVWGCRRIGERQENVCGRPQSFRAVQPPNEQEEAGSKRLRATQIPQRGSSWRKNWETLNRTVQTGQPTHLSKLMSSIPGFSVLTLRRGVSRRFRQSLSRVWVHS